MPQLSTQEEILSYLQAHSTASARELSRVLHTTVPNIRHHLDILLEDGSIEIAGKVSKGERGRPTILYMLSTKARQNNFIPLLNALLDDYLENCTEAEMEVRLSGLAKKILAGSSAPKTGLTARLNQAMNDLNGMSYQARWEAHAAGPRVFLANCPYQAILVEHPELCRLDQAILSNLLQLPCKLIDRQDPLTGKHPHCIFQIQNR